MIVDDVGRAVRLAREAGQITAGMPSWADHTRCETLTSVLKAAGDLVAAEATCAAGLARCRAANSLYDLAQLLNRMVILDLEAGRIQDAAAHLREALQILMRSVGWYRADHQPGLLRASVRGDRTQCRGSHDVGRVRPYAR